MSSHSVPPNSHASTKPPVSRPADREGEQIPVLKQQLKQGDLRGLRKYLARTRVEQEWNDRDYVLSQVVSEIRVPLLDFMCDAEPEAADLAVIRTAFFSDLAKTMRGTGTSDKVGAERFQSAWDCVKPMMDALHTAARLDPKDPTAFVAALPAMTIFGQLTEHQLSAFHYATALEPDLPMACRAITNRLAKRWYGSHEQSVEFARHALTKAGPNSAMLGCLFWAHTLVAGHLQYFDQDKRAAEAYYRNPEVRKELDDVFDRWTTESYEPQRSGIELLNHAAFWYYEVRDVERFRRALELTGNPYRSSPWNKSGPGARWYQDTVLQGIPPAEPVVESKFDQCITFTTHALMMLRAGKGTEMEKALNAAMILARTVSKEESERLVPLVLLGFAAMRKAQQKPDESRKLREQAVALLEAQAEIPALGEYARVMANVLVKVDDNRRAIAYWEKAIELMGETADSMEMGEMFASLGLCFNQMGLNDHAVIPLRAAERIFRTYPEDPRLTQVLLNLGNALRKSSPGEAEAAYKEVAAWHVAKAQYAEAAASWVNLGIVCADQKRFVEALEYYEKALKVREQTKGTRPDAIGRVQLNMAGVYRQMAKFKEAHSMVDRAIKMATAEPRTLAAAYDTKGMTYLDAGEDKKAVEWLRKSIAEESKRPSPDMLKLKETTEREMQALERMGKAKDVAEARVRLEKIEAAMRAVPQMSGELSEGRGAKVGSVQVELGFGSAGPASGVIDARLVAEKLHRSAREKNAGSYSGTVRLTENTTLIFYGDDAETLFQAMEPALMSARECAGARVMIRQGAQLREVMVAAPASAVN